jgi:predicted nucleotidyltransferase
MKKEQILQDLKLLKKEFIPLGIEKVGLFGSYSKNKDVLTSDLDVVFQFNKEFYKKNDPWKYFEIVEYMKAKLVSKFNIKVDLFDMDSSSRYKENILQDAIYV